MNQPKVSVYIPCHNYGRYLERSVDSVFQQKFHDWELIIINDGSTDNTEEIVERYRQQPQVHIVHQDKQGLTVSNNIALRLSRGQYIMRLDADDYLDESALLVLSNILDTHPEVDLVYPDYYRVDEEGGIIDVERREKIGVQSDVLDIPAHGACTMIRKKCLLELGGYNEALTCQDGYDLWLRFIHKYKPYNVNTPLFYYRQHTGSLTKNQKQLLETRQQLKRSFVKREYHSKMPNILAIIPVRREGDISKNVALRPIAGKPLIDFTLDEVLKTKLVNKVVVTSNDEDVLGHAGKREGIVVLKRPSTLALPNSRIEPTVYHVLSEMKSKYRYEPDAIMLLYPHAPLRRFVHIEKAIDTMLIFDVDSVVSIFEDLNVYYQHTSKGLVSLQRDRLLRLEREALYRENGAVYLSRRDAITENNFLSEKLGHIVMLPEESIKVDSEFNFWMAEKVLEDWKE